MPISSPPEYPQSGRRPSVGVDGPIRLPSQPDTERGRSPRQISVRKILGVQPRIRFPGRVLVVGRAGVSGNNRATGQRQTGDRVEAGGGGGPVTVRRPVLRVEHDSRFQPRRSLFSSALSLKGPTVRDLRGRSWDGLSWPPQLQERQKSERQKTGGFTPGASEMSFIANVPQANISFPTIALSHAARL